MKLLVISCSLSEKSRSALMAEGLVEAWNELGQEAELVDLRQLPLPFCDAGPAYGDKGVVELRSKIEQADALALAVPIYNFDVGGAARNLLAMTGRVWQEKVVGFIGAAGGQGSYMAMMSLANSLMLDFRCVIVPRFVYATGSSFEAEQLVDPEVGERILGLAKDLQRFAGALSGERSRE